MSEDRPGEGKPVSSSEAKLEMGRAFVRAAKDHVGERSNSTEYLASRRLEKGFGSQEPTKTEIEMVFEDNPAEVAALKSAGMNKMEIYEALKDRR